MSGETFEWTTQQQDGETVLVVTWHQADRTTLVSGTKRVKGGPNEATKIVSDFANDLKRNFSDRFPPPPEPEPDEEMI